MVLELWIEGNKWAQQRIKSAAEYEHETTYWCTTTFARSFTLWF